MATQNTSTKNKLFLFCMAITFVLDQVTKKLIVDNFHYGERLPVIAGFFELTHVRNPGGAFSFFADGPVEQRMIFFIGSTALALVLLVLFLRRLEPSAHLSAIALGSIMGGALGNLVDRLAYGEVIDFLVFHLWRGYTWPTFNVADSAIVVGVAILMIEIFLEDGESTQEDPSKEDLSEDPASARSS